MIPRHHVLVALVTACVLTTAGPARAQTSFPQEITDPAGTITVYQPQPESINGNVLTGRAAISLQIKTQKDPIFGAFWFTSIIDTDDDAGVASIRDIKVTRVRWPESTDQAEAKFTAIVEAAAASHELTVSTERLAASLETAEREQKSLAELKNDPPTILFANQLSVLLLFDGDPKWSDVDNSSYERALNTPYLVVRDKRSQACFLSSGTLWYTAKAPLGPWQPTTSPPADLVAMLPKPDADDPVPDRPPAIVVATAPTELIVSDGPPKFKPIGDGKLLYVENTETPWVREVDANQVWVLLSGRWFRAASTDGPWTFVRADQLPASFKSIPAASDLGGIRVSVAGTDEAEDAVLDASIPKTAAINRSEATLDVEYEGDPKFEPIPGTSVAHAVNTPAQVLQIAGRYYAVDNGVWFTAANATGPWAVADSIPDAEIEKIPASSPVYNVTYVKVYQSTPEVVYVGYTPGYLWSFPYYGVPVYGTGFYYPPYPGFYYPRPYTWGFHVGYNPWTGWNFGVSWNVGFMNFGMAWGGGYRGPWGAYYRRPCCGGWYGGYRPGWGGGYHGGHNNINIGSINIGNNINFGNQGRIANNLRGRGNAELLRQPSLYNHPDLQNRRANPATARGGLQQAGPGRGQNNVFADGNGNVVRRGANGGLEAREGNRWQNLDRANAGSRAGSIDRGSVQRASSARQRGGAREMRQRQVPRRGGGGRRR